MSTISSPISIHTLHRTFQAAATQKDDSNFIETGADFRAHQNKSLLRSFFNGLFSFFSKTYSINTEKEITAKREVLQKNFPDLAKKIMGKAVSGSGKMAGELAFDFAGETYTLKQQNDLLILQCDKNPAKPLTLHDVTFTQIKKAMLKNYMDSERAAGNQQISLDGIDLNEMNLDGINFKGVVISSQEELVTMIRNSGNLTGVELAKGLDTTNWKLPPTKKLSLSMARQLVSHGSDVQTVIRTYLNSNSPDKNLTSFNLKGIDLRDFNLNDVDLSKANLDGAAYDKTILNAKLDPDFKAEITALMKTVKHDSTVLLSQHRSNKYSSRY